MRVVDGNRKFIWSGLIVTRPARPHCVEGKHLPKINKNWGLIWWWWRWSDSDQHKPKYTSKLYDYQSLCDCILSTWCYMTSLHVIRSPTPFPTVYAWCTVAVFEVCIQVQAGRFYHTRNIKILPRKRRWGGGGGVGETFMFLRGKSGCHQSDQKMMEN